MKAFFRCLILTLLFTLAACSNTVPGNSAVDVQLQVTPSPTDPTKATVIGRVISSTTQQPLVIRVGLAEVTRDGDRAVMALDEAHSPATESKEDGTFVLSNITAREYTIVVGEVPTNYVIISEDQNNAKVIDAKAGVVTNLGELRVNL